MSNNLIYALKDPYTSHIKYIGMSTRGLERPHEHLLAVPKKDKTRRANWIRSLKAKGSVPIIVVVAYYNTPQEADDEEDQWIVFFKALGCPLTNHQSGGKVRFKVDEETKQKISRTLTGRKKSEETRKKLSVARLGKKIGQKGWFKLGHSPSQETREKMRKAHSGRVRGPLSKETRRKISEANKGQVPWLKGRRFEGRCSVCRTEGHNRLTCTALGVNP